MIPIVGNGLENAKENSFHRPQRDIILSPGVTSIMITQMITLQS